MYKKITLLILICFLFSACNSTSPPVKDNSSKPSSSSSEKLNNSEQESDDLNDDADYDNIDTDIDDDNIGTDIDDYYLDVGLSGVVSISQQSKLETPVLNFKEEQKGGYDMEAAAMRKSILEAKDDLKITGTTYYISPNGDDFNEGTSPDAAWESIDALAINAYAIEPGDAVLFERGGVYRQNSSYIVKDGVTYGAYGEGEKPCIYGSAKDYADVYLWEPSNKRNVWKIQFPQKDAGIVVFNNGEYAGVKKSGLSSLKSNGDFYHHESGETLYMYCDNGNPGTVYDNIEIGTKQPIFIIYGGYGNITIDNICFRYTGDHAITFYENNHHITITNCELGWIGGSLQDAITRYGNAIQFWSSCWDVCVENNWIYQVYDAGITYQYSRYSNTGGGKYDNISFSKNLIEYCTYSIEIATHPQTGWMRNINFNDNIMRFAGYGWGNQRPSRVDESHINAWNRDDFWDPVEGSDIPRIHNFSIKNNVFDCSSRQAVSWATSKKYPGVTVSGNTFFQKAYQNNPVMKYGPAGETFAINQTQLETAIATFDPSPKLVKWIE